MYRTLQSNTQKKTEIKVYRETHLRHKNGHKIPFCLCDRKSIKQKLLMQEREFFYVVCLLKVQCLNLHIRVYTCDKKPEIKLKKKLRVSKSDINLSLHIY